MDTLTFRTPILLRHLTFSEQRKIPISEIDLEKVLTGLDMPYEQVTPVYSPYPFESFYPRYSLSFNPVPQFEISSSTAVLFHLILNVVLFHLIIFVGYIRYVRWISSYVR